MVKISVIIPVYNGEKYLNRCLDSLINQTFSDWTAICVDDGSVDKTGKILDEYAKQDKRFIVVHKKNAGVSAARNDGIKRATGQYIHFMDADDIIDANYYEQMIKHTGDADIICSGFVSNSKHSSNLIYKHNHIVHSMFGKVFWTQVLLKSFVWRYLFKTEFIKKNKLVFDTSFVSQEDAIFVLQSFVYANMISIVPNVNYHYIFNDNSALNKKDKAHHDKLKKQYKIGKSFRKKFAVDNNVSVLWYLRKIVSVLFMG
nr:glycosyltransferase family 2 protein [Candidatus Enterousia merdequi]